MGSPLAISPDGDAVVDLTGYNNKASLAVASALLGAPPRARARGAPATAACGGGGGGGARAAPPLRNVSLIASAPAYHQARKRSEFVASNLGLLGIPVTEPDEIGGEAHLVRLEPSALALSHLKRRGGAARRRRGRAAAVVPPHRERRRRERWRRRRRRRRA